MMRFVSLISLVLLTTRVCSGQVVQPPVVSLDPMSLVFSPSSNSLVEVTSHAVMVPWDFSFIPVDSLPHEDDFWSNMLVSDADHDGLSEIVIYYIPGGGALNRVMFFEDDGTGLFDQVFEIQVEGDVGLLAIGDVDDDGLTDLFMESLTYPFAGEYVRYESSTPGGFPGEKVWQGFKQGNIVNFRGFIADSDGDGSKEFIISDSNLDFSTSQVKVFESAPDNQMNLIYSTYVNGYPGNPVVADFDQDGRQEISVALGPSWGSIVLIESTGNDTYAKIFELPHPLSNAYQLGLVDEVASPDGIPRLLLPGHTTGGHYWMGVFESLSPNSITGVHAVPIHSLVYASIPQIDVRDIVVGSAPEVVLARLGGPVPIYRMKVGGKLDLIDEPYIENSIEIVAAERPGHLSGVIAVGIYPHHANPEGRTIVLGSR